MEANLQIDFDHASNLDKLRRGVLYSSFNKNQQAAPANADLNSQVLLNENIQDSQQNVYSQVNYPSNNDYQKKPASKKISTKIKPANINYTSEASMDVIENY